MTPPPSILQDPRHLPQGAGGLFAPQGKKKAPACPVGARPEPLLMLWWVLPGKLRRQWKKRPQRKQPQKMQPRWKPQMQPQKM